jgi:folate-binding protein YgfZ
MTPGYEALMDGAALLDLSDRGRIRVTGEDRARLLHAMTTNHVLQMTPGQGLYTFFLDAQGRILADAVLLCFEDHFLLDTGAVTRHSLAAHLEHFIIADDVTLEDVTEQTFCLAVEGPKAVEVAGEGGIAAPYQRCAHVRWGDLTAASISATGAQAVRIYGPLDDRDDTISFLEGAGAIAASPEDADLARMKHFIPVYGIDITERTLPQETQQAHALHFQKGCYIGQEIVERVRSRGHLNRLLMGFRGRGSEEAATAPARGAKLRIEGQEAGEVTSAGAAHDEFFGLAWVRAPHAQPGVMAEIEGRAAEIFAPTD